MRRKISLLVIAAFVATLAVVNHGCSPGEPPAPKEMDDTLSFDLNAANLQAVRDRLGADDGYAFTIFYGADTHGSLENCGCPHNPMGGLAWRVSYMKAFKHRSNKEVPMLFVDAGNLFTDDRYQAGGGLPQEALIKNRWVTKAYGDFVTDAANLCFSDLPYAAELFKKDGFEQRVRELPFIKRLVSANVHPEGDSLVAPEPYVIREISLKRGVPGKKLRVGIVGFTELKPSGMGDQRQESFAGFRIEDPLAAAQRVIPELKQKADLIVVLAYLSQGQARKLATQNPDVDTIIGANQINGTEEADHFGSATIVYSYNQTKYLGELRYYLKADGLLDRQTNRHVGLDKEIPEDPRALEAVNAARDEFTAEQKKSAETAAATTIRPITNSDFVGAESCASCHQEEYDIWKKSGHAHAFATLERKSQQFDNECVSCHVVAFGKGGYQSLAATPQLTNVQCESCHGPGKNHIAKPARGFGVTNTPADCLQCHTQPNSPDFNFATYWPKIKHGKSAL